MANIINKIHGTSLVSTSINAPIEFGVNTLSTDDKSLILDENFELVVDENGITSIIKFKTIPYIDYSNFDYDRRKWFDVDKYGSLWRKYVPGEYIIEEDTVMDPNWKMDYRYYSMENILKNTYGALNIMPIPNNPHVPQDPDVYDVYTDLEFKQYKPITLVIEGEEYTDITDYAHNVHPELDYIAPEKNKQFYFKNDRIYTNTDLTLYQAQDIQIQYFYTMSEVKVHCQMHTNSDNYSNYTPVVDFYLLKLTGQTL